MYLTEKTKLETCLPKSLKPGFNCAAYPKICKI